MSSSQYYANAIRALTMDAVQAAKSGHPGAPMGMADIAYVLWKKFLKHNPADPNWPDRDRFVLSNGHGSMLLYSLLHLTGYDLTIDDIKAFRQLHSKTPGHPEYHETPGVETTTGPLGQGIANGVGMALAEKMMAAQFNHDQDTIVDHRTWVFLGDGCLMEGVSHEAASLAGTWKLGKLICFYDDNGISIDGEIDGWFTDDTPSRFEAYGWQVIPSVDGHNIEAISTAIEQAVENKNQPTLICCKTQIGFGSPNKAGTAAIHGSPLGTEEIEATRQKLQWPHAPFEIPENIYKEWDCKEEGAKVQENWKKQWQAYEKSNPEMAEEFERRLSLRLVPEWENAMQQLIEDTQSAGKALASRAASQGVIAYIAGLLPELVGGSADLTGSNLTNWPDSKPITGDDASGNYIYYGVREFGMSAISNGISLHGGFRPFTGTFLTFMEYARNAVRMSALMGIPNLFVYTHDSIGQGEDGPTHQPVEQVANLRATPNMSVWRPCDSVETVVAWKAGIERVSGPTSFVFSRQGLPCQERTREQLQNITKGGYILWEPESSPEAIILATGSEVSIAVAAAEELKAKGTGVRVVSMPSTDVFEAQDETYKQVVLPNELRKRVAIEAAHSDYWRKWVGLDGEVVGMESFGLSAPGPLVCEELGFTVENLVTAVNKVM